MKTGLSSSGLEELDDALSVHVEQGGLPGAVALVARGPDVHVTTVGRRALEKPAPMTRDSIFRIASLTKPITGAAAMLLVEDGAMALDDPVARWIPELENPRVLRTPQSPLDDTVAAKRQITVEDVLSFHLGFGVIMTVEPYPIIEAEKRLGLRTLGPPWPPHDLSTEEWITRFASLPLIDQPGSRWRYNTGATVAGLLVERVAGASLADVMRERIFEPIGMLDTGFYVPESKVGRFTSLYAPAGESGTLELLDAPSGWWSSPPRFADGASWLVSTVDDLWAFASMLRSERSGLLSPASVESMTRDRTTSDERAESEIFLGPHSGWGLMMAVPASRSVDTPDELAVPGGFGWDGGSGTTWRTDPRTGLTGILLTQVTTTSPEPSTVFQDFWALAYGAMEG